MDRYLAAVAPFELNNTLSYVRLPVGSARHICRRQGARGNEALGPFETGTSSSVFNPRRKPLHRIVARHSSSRDGRQALPLEFM